MGMTVPFCSKENWGSESLRKCLVRAHKGQTHSQSQIQVNLSPESMPFPHSCTNPSPAGFSSSLQGVAFPPLCPHKGPQTPSFAPQPTNAFQLVSETSALTTHLLVRSRAAKCCVSPRGMAQGHHPRLAPEFSQVNGPSQWRFCRNQLLFPFPVFTATGNKHLTSTYHTWGTWSAFTQQEIQCSH